MNGQGFGNGSSGDYLDRSRSRWATLLKLAYPGLGLKRWLLAGALGIGVCAIGAALLLRILFSLSFPDFLPSYYEGVLLLAVGIGMILLAIYGLYRSIGPLILASNTVHDLADTIYTRRFRGRGPRVVAIGGGTGLSVLLRGLKGYTDNLTAIISVADDGGSSGRLRRELGVLPPGDFRNCIVAMSEAESILTELFQYRFDTGDGLKGHSFGNLFIVAMTDITQSFERALYESSRVLAVNGRIVPATTATLSLSARLKDGEMVRGESNITERGGQIDQLLIDPSDAQAFPPAVEAIEQAQLIVIGPGSLYTSILPNLLVSRIAGAIKDAAATKIYVCNVATEKGETEGYTVADHAKALQTHTSPTIVDYVLANSSPVRLGPSFLGEPVMEVGSWPGHIRLQQADLADPENPVRHDSTKLAEAVMRAYQGTRRSKSLVRT